MKKKTQSERQSEQRDTSAEPKTFRFDRSVLRYVFCSLALLIVLAWTLMNFGSVAGAVGRIGSLLFPFLLGGGMAFLMNTLLRPLESAENGGSERDSTVLTPPEFIYSTYNSLLESGWRMDEIDRMDMPGFLKMRAWNARQEQKKKEPRQRYIDEVWSSLKPGGL